ncbi:hypothetical protein ACLOJK_022339 [Asimina triloba]
MDKSSADNFQVPLPLAYSLVIVCLHMLFNWFGRSCEGPFSQTMPFFYSLLQFDFADSKMINGTQLSPDSDKHDAVVLSGEEVEMVMANLGFVCKSNDFQESLGADKLSALFDELEPSLDELKEAFCVFDINKDGFIDAEELSGILRKLGFRDGYCKINACERMIRAVSNKGCDRIDLNEFVKFMESSFC